MNIRSRVGLDTTSSKRAAAPASCMSPAARVGNATAHNSSATARGIALLTSAVFRVRSLHIVPSSSAVRELQGLQPDSWLQRQQLVLRPHWPHSPPPRHLVEAWLDYCRCAKREFWKHQPAPALPRWPS